MYSFFCRINNNLLVFGHTSNDLLVFAVIMAFVVMSVLRVSVGEEAMVWTVVSSLVTT